ncbi:MAG: 5-formyltetrahydrofolate cyclo-ligase [Pyrinomonadaceae bacterium]
MTKSELRKIYLERRRSIPADAHSAFSREIVDRLFNEIDINSISSIHCYLSLEHVGEVETGILFDRVWNDFPHIITTAPKIDALNLGMDSVIYQRDTPTNEDRWKIPEPSGSEIIAPEALDLVVVPLLCFDLRGHRAGYGKGFYDRFLAKCRPECVKAGLSFFPPIDFIDDVHEADVPLDLCLTPSGAFRFH